MRFIIDLLLFWEGPVCLVPLQVANVIPEPGKPVRHSFPFLDVWELRSWVLHSGLTLWCLSTSVCLTACEGRAWRERRKGRPGEAWGDGKCSKLFMNEYITCCKASWTQGGSRVMFSWALRLRALPLQSWRSSTVRLFCSLECLSRESPNCGPWTSRTGAEELRSSGLESESKHYNCVASEGCHLLPSSYRRSGFTEDRNKHKSLVSELILTLFLYWNCFGCLLTLRCPLDCFINTVSTLSLQQWIYKPLWWKLYTSLCFTKLCRIRLRTELLSQ